MSKAYRVVWAVEVDADSPTDAATHALARMRSATDLAVQFTVFEDAGEGQAWLVDLLTEIEKRLEPPAVLGGLPTRPTDKESQDG